MRTSEVEEVQDVEFVVFHIKTYLRCLFDSIELNEE